uniref:hypothetical protein n=1 Tax=Eubacterium cellulosolvens TaxID=29322 RepID=UPI00048814CB|nr:hypothetical protein [[Eubacterium] cellulosolvens]
MNILFLFFNNSRSENNILKKISSIEKYDAECVFKPIRVWGRVIRRIHIISGLPGIGIWMLSWKKRITQYDVCVCVASRYSANILKWIKRKNKNIKCINYFWDKVDISGYPVEESRILENWSFDKSDCQKYKMIYNPQFYVINSCFDKYQVLYDVTYVGADRNGRLTERTKLVTKYYSLFKSLGISCWFYYVTQANSVPEDIKHVSLLPEKDFYKICSQGKAILDLVDGEIKWMTFRPLLALSNGKKVITNNSDIVKEPYYKKQNIFILGIDDEGQLKSFIESGFDPYNDDVLEYYSVENWCERFWGPVVNTERLVTGSGP